MSSLKFLVFCVIFFSAALAQDDRDNQSLPITTSGPEETTTISICTEDDKKKIKEDCGNNHSDTLGNVDLEGLSLGFFEDPTKIWEMDELCISVEPLAAYVECYFGGVKKCHMDHNMEDDLPEASVVKSSVQDLCMKKEAWYKKVNNTEELDKCIQEKTGTASECMISSMSKPYSCMGNSKWMECVAQLDTCFEGETVFVSYFENFRPAGCGACSIMATVSLMIFAALLALIN